MDHATDLPTAPAAPVPFSARLFTIMLIILAVILGAAFWGAQQSRDYAAAAFQTRSRELETLRMLSLLQDAEVGQRGYLLTEDISYLRPYEDALPEIDRLRGSFKALVAEGNATFSHTERIDTLIAERIGLLTQTIDLERAGRRDEALALIKTNIGKSKMDEIRAIVQQTNVARAERLKRQQAQLAVIITGVRITEVLGGIMVVLAALSMIRQFRLATDARERALESQAAAAVAANAANKAKSQFLATMSHELRTPMTAILGMCDLLQAGNQSSDDRQITRTLVRSAHTLLTLLNDILDISKIEAGALKLDSVDFRLSAVLAEVGTLFQPIASQKGLLLEVDAAPSDVPDVFRGDPKRLQQIVSNLVGNAIKFTEKGRVRVRSRVLENRDGRTQVEVAVEDTGVGVSPEAQARLFRDFEQEDTSTSRRFGGTGLGLSISKRLVEAMGGVLNVASVKGEGSRFFFTLWLAEGDAAAISENDGAAVQDGAKQLQGMRLDILLAEDTPATQFLISKMMGLWGHSVTVVGNGEEAVAAANARAWDVILMDMQMPVLDGPGAVKQIRAGGGPSAAAPIIALTADAVQDNHRAYRDAGCDAVATKPIEWPVLAHHIAALVDTSVLTRPVAAAEAAADAAGQVAHDNGAPDADLPLMDMPMLEDLRKSLGNDILAQLIANSVANLNQYLPDLMAGIAQGDQIAVARLAHKIRGVTSQLGAVRATALARRIEMDGGDPDTLRATADRLERSVADTLPQLKAMMATPPAV